jgi:hypothetical protein
MAEENKEDQTPAEHQPAPHHHEAHHAEPHHEAKAQKQKVDINHITRTIFQKKYVASVIIYLIIALIMFEPITASITTVAPGSGGDTFLNLWGVWWINHAVFNLHTSIWQTSLLFWPVGGNLVYQTMSPLGSLLVAPLLAISIPFAYNILFFLGFVLSGLTMFILAEYITENPYAAFFAGLVFAFSSIHIPLALDHIDWINIEWIPLALYFFLRMIKDQKKYLYAVGLGITFVLITFMGDLEQGLMTIVLLLLVFVLYLAYKSTRHLIFNKKFWFAVALALVVAFVIGSFGYVPIISTLTQPVGISNANYLNDVQHNELWSDDLLSFFLPSYYNGIFNGISQSYSNIYSADPSERSAYIGYTVIILALIGVYKNFNKTKLWLVIGLVFGWLALGPSLQIGGNLTSIPGIFSVYHLIPGLSVIREPDRFDVIFTIATAMLAALGIKTLFDDYEKSGKKGLMQNGILVIAVISILFLIESNGAPLTSGLLSLDVTHISIPPFYTLLSNVTGNFSVLQLPALANQNSALPSLYPGMATYYETAYAKPLVGGDITRTNESDIISLYNIPLAVQASNLEMYGTEGYSSPVNENFTNETILTLYNYRTSFVTVERGAYNLSSLTVLGTYMQSIFGDPIYSDNSTIAFATARAINSSVYRSYVAYPALTDWEEVSILVNGTTRYLWNPVGLGAIQVFAPFPNTTNIAQQLYGGQVYSVNTTIRFTALATGAPELLELGTLSSTGSLSPIATLNITDKFASYNLTTRFTSGEYGQTLVFLTSNSSTALNQGIVAITNITFSRN